MLSRAPGAYRLSRFAGREVISPRHQGTDKPRHRAQPGLAHDGIRYRGEDRAMQPEIRVRRVYEPPEPQDGSRILVDRLWPRGLRKDAAGLDEWARDVAPSNELRIWYGHDPAKF